MADSLELAQRIAHSLSERSDWDHVALRATAASCLSAAPSTLGPDVLLKAVLNVALRRLAQDAREHVDISPGLSALVEGAPSDVLDGTRCPAAWSAILALLEPVAMRAINARTNPLAQALTALSAALHGRNDVLAARNFASSLQDRLPYPECPIIAFGAVKRSTVYRSMRTIRTRPEEYFPQ